MAVAGSKTTSIISPMAAVMESARNARPAIVSRLPLDHDPFLLLLAERHSVLRRGAISSADARPAHMSEIR